MRTAVFRRVSDGTINVEFRLANGEIMRTPWSLLAQPAAITTSRQPSGLPKNIDPIALFDQYLQL